MKINIPERAWEHFWEEPPPNTVAEFWAFRFPPKNVRPDDRIEFYFRKQLVAEAKVWVVERPGLSACDHSGRFKNRHKVAWLVGTFRDLRAGMQPCVECGAPTMTGCACG
jgi:hypothetical protein